MDIKNYFKMMVEKNASDMFYRTGSNVRMRIDGKVVSVDSKIVSLDEVNAAVRTYFQ
jgi:Tfp pilus assembly ATPase PilU